MAVFFTADTHFGHAGGRALYRRPFPTVAAMDAAMVERWNATVSPADEVWHLGDVVVGTRVTPFALLERLQGRKHLVAGNNDRPEVTGWSGWSSVQPYAELTLDGVGLVLCHYAFRTWRNIGRGWWNLHGHSHGRMRPMTRQVDVGVDAWDFRPVTLAGIMASRPGGRNRAARDANPPAD
ncbi:metallophosphoesterase family protein [Roseomonas sp. BN140053]|uniref:metallophosphoesterase family protein n=1 Tax=Roseomonas sp. BN140053 TaxID=3391898 RepID=UPI0039ECEB68